MKTIIYLFFIVSIAFCPDFLHAQTDFFNYQGEAVPLTISQEKISVIFSGSLTRNQIDSLLNSEGVSGELKQIHSVALENFFTLDLQEQAAIGELIEQLQSLPEVQLVNPVYERNGTEAIIFDRFVVMFDPSITEQQIEQLNGEYHVETVRNRGDIYTFRLTGASGLPVLDLANLYYQSLSSEWAMPDFIVQFELFDMPGDQYFPWQYYFHNTGQTGGQPDADIDAPEAWSISKGNSNIVIAVIDEGVEDHPDLPQSRLTVGYDALNGQSGIGEGVPEGNENHGMACAGLIAATHNSIGIAGLAPNCKIMPIRIADGYGTFTSLGNIAAAFDFTWDPNVNPYGVFADVLSNSWGGDHDVNDPMFINFRQAVERAMTQGRNGKGCVVVFAAGNNPTHIATTATIPGVLTVGATDKSDNQQFYSPAGAEMDVVAPSGSVGIGLDYGSCPDPGGGPPIKYYRRELLGDVWTIDIANITPGPDQQSWGGWNDGTNDCPNNDWNVFLWSDRPGEPHPAIEYSAHFGGTSAACPQGCRSGCFDTFREPWIYRKSG